MLSARSILLSKLRHSSIGQKWQNTRQQTGDWADVADSYRSSSSISSQLAKQPMKTAKKIIHIDTSTNNKQNPLDVGQF